MWFFKSIDYKQKVVFSDCDLILKDTRTQGYLFPNDIKMCTGICLGNAPIIQHRKYTTATSLIKNKN